MERYTKADLVDAIYEKVGMDRKEIRVIVDSFIDELKTALMEGKTIELRGFGTFEIKIRKGRKDARNPKTGEILPIGSHGIALFRAGQDLKKEVWRFQKQDLGKKEQPDEE